MRVGMLTTWSTQCGIAEYSRTLAGAFGDRDDVDLVVLGSRNYDERETGEPDDGVEVVRCFDVELWNRHGRRDLDVDTILDLELDVLHVQYENVLYNRGQLRELIDRFDGPTFITYHDNCIAPDFRWFEFGYAFSHRAGVGPGSPEVIPFPVRELPKSVRTFGLGRTREDVITPICARNGWTFESAATSETALGGQGWRSWRDLHDWLRGADAIVLWYSDNAMAGCSQAARTALATGRPLIVNDTTWFRELPGSAIGFWKLQDDPAALESTLREVLAVSPLVAAASAGRLVDWHVARYQEALRESETHAVAA